MHSFSRAHCLAAGRGRRSCLALHGSASGSGLRSPYASSPMHQAVSCSTLFYLWTGSSSPVASHPVSRRRSYLRLRTASVLSDGDFHPIVGAHSQAHIGPDSPSGTACRTNHSGRHQNSHLPAHKRLLGRQRHIHGQASRPLCFWPGHKFEVAPQTVKDLTKRREKRLKRPEKGYLFEFAHWLNGSERLG